MFKRLTTDKVYLNSIRFGIQVNFPPHCGHEKAKEVDDFVKNVFDRLAAYEDSGLTPEQVQELAKAKAEGRLYILPVKVGDAVYFASHLYEKVEEYQVTEITNPIYDITVIAREHQYIAPIPLCSIADIGKTVFLSREEAEKAIGGGKK